MLLEILMNSHGLSGAFYGFLGTITLLLNVEDKSRKKVIVLLLQGGIIGHITGIAVSSVLGVFESSPELTAVSSFCAGFLGLASIQALADKLFKQMGFDMDKAEDKLKHRQEIVSRVTKNEKSITKNDLETAKQKAREEIARINKEICDLKNKKDV